MKKVFLLFLSVLLILSSCTLKEDSTSTGTTGDGTGTGGSTTIKVLKPNGGESLPEGSSYEISWTGTGTTVVRIQFSIDNGSTWSMVVDSLKNTGVYTWFPVPNLISNQCRIRVSTVDGTTSDTNDQIFAIVRNSNKSLSINSPKKDDQWEAGSSKQIKWFSSGIDSVKIEYTTDNGNHWNFITSDKKNTGVYYWEPVPNMPSTLARVRIMDAKAGVPSSESELFSILPEPKLKVISPNGGEIVLAGTSRKIEWISQNIENIKLAYTTNNGFNWVTIKEAIPSTGFFIWEPVPNVNSQLCKVRVYDAKDGEPSDVSDSTFSITNLISQTIEVTYPNGGERWQAGTNQSITWRSSGIPKIKLEFTSNNGLTWNTIVDQLPNTGAYEWNIPNSISTQCLVKISDASDNDPVDQSNGLFRIVPKPELRVIKPNGGESITAGILDTIKWSSVGVENVYIEYTPNNGINWFTIVEKTPSSGIYLASFTTPGTQNKIRIIDADNHSPQDESDGTFIVTPEPKITVVSPNGKEEWFAGSSDNIKWTSTNIENVKIEYTTNNGASWNLIVENTPSDGAFAWSPIPDVSTLQCRIRISDAKDGIPSDVSDENFTITHPGIQMIKVKTPNGSENWSSGSSQSITWDASGITNVKIEYTANNGISWNTITASTPSTGFYTWVQIPNIPSTNCKIRISDALDNSPSDDSDAFFTIGPAASIRVLEPNGNDTWIKGTNKEIKWTSTGIVDVKIEFTTNAGGTWSTIINSTPSTGSYWWYNVPEASNSMQCRIRISEAVYGVPSDLSDDNFAIMSPGAQQLKVISPNGGEKWNVGTLQNIIWDAGGIANIKIEYTTNNGQTWNLVIASTPSNGYYTWNPTPNTPGTNCKIRLSDALDGDPTDLSDNFFSILPAPSIKIISPNGGESIQTGSNTEIRWISENVLNVKIEYTTNGGAVWNVITNSVESTGSYIWTDVPNLNSQQCKIRVSDASNGTSSDISDNNFSITNAVTKSLKIVSPNGGETWEAGTVQNITWSSSAVSDVKIELTTDQGINWLVLKDSYKGGAYEWNILSTLNSVQCQIRVSDVTNSKISDVSDANFTITPTKFIQVTKPSGNLVFKDSDPIDIEWESSGIQSVGIRYTTTNGAGHYPDTPQFYTLVEKMANTGKITTSFSLPSEQYYVVVFNADDGANGSPSARSIGKFTILKTDVPSSPSITLMAPNGDEQWLSSPSNVAITDIQRYHPYEIKWRATNINKVKIEWSSNGGGSWYLVPGAQSTENDGSFTWAPGRLESATERPDSSDNCRIRISSADAGVNASDLTDGYFSIHESKKLQINTPNGGQYFYLTAAEMLEPKASSRWPMVITWTGYAITGNVNLYYSLQNGANGTWQDLILNYPSTGIYGWDYFSGPNPQLMPSTLLRIKIVDTDNNKIWDENDGPVNINVLKPE